MSADPVTMIIKAIKIKIALNRLSRAKENAVRLHMGYPPIIPWYEQCWINFMASLRRFLCETFCPCCIYDRNRHLKRLEIPKSPWKRMFKDGTYENEVFKNVLGFVGGIVLGVVFYFIMVFQIGFLPMTSAIVGVVMGPILTIGLAFSLNVRCIVLLMLPQLFSSKGRTFLLLYAVILVMNHPVKNFNHNIIVMSNSSTCGQQMAYNQTKDLVEQMSSPLAGILGSVRVVLKALKEFSEKLRRAFTSLKVAVKEITSVISNVFRWLGTIVDVCNAKMGAPYKKCTKVFDDGYSNCRNVLGWFFNWICEIVRLVQHVCHVARIGELLCFIASAIKSLVISKVAPPLNNAVDKIYDMFYFNVTIYYKYEYNITQSKSYSKVKDDIMQEITKRLSTYTWVIGLIQNFMAFAFILLLIKALVYRRKYLTNDKYDNVYITYKVRDIEERRLELDKEGIMPLSGKESGKYIKAISPVLAKSERRKMVKGMFLLLIGGFHSSFYIICDYTLYWLLSLIRKNGFLKTANMEGVASGLLMSGLMRLECIPPHLKMHVQGKGAISDMYRALIGMFDPIAEAGLDIDTSPCLPNPSTPDFAVYKEIGSIFALCLFMTIFEAYGLRLRHVVAACYYPQRERARAVWLYNHILKMRGSFLKFARRQARRKFANFQEQEKISMRGRLAIQFPVIGKILKFLGWKRKYCLSCGKEGREEDLDNFIHCANADCEAVYCMDCFTDLNNLCTVCMNPVDYGDISDVSEERDSSEDEEDVARKKMEAEERKQRMEEKRKEQTASKQLLNLRTTLGITESEIKRQANPQEEYFGYSEIPEEDVNYIEKDLTTDQGILVDPDYYDADECDQYDYSYQYKDKEEDDGEDDFDYEDQRPTVELVTEDIFEEDMDEKIQDGYYHGDDYDYEYSFIEPEEVEMNRYQDNRVHTL